MITSKILSQNDVDKLSGAVSIEFQRINDRGSTVGEYNILIQCSGYEKSFELTADFPIINGFINTLATDLVDGKTVSSYFSSQSVHFWQYVHAHAWPQLYNLLIPYILICQISSQRNVDSVLVKVPFLSRLSLGLKDIKNIPGNLGDQPVTLEVVYGNLYFGLKDFLRRRANYNLKAIVYLLNFGVKVFKSSKKPISNTKIDAVFLTYGSRYSGTEFPYTDRCFGLLQQEIIDAGYSTALIDLDDISDSHQYVSISNFYKLPLKKIYAFMTGATKFPQYRASFIKKSSHMLPESMREAIYDVLRESHTFYRMVSTIDYIVGAEIVSQLNPKMAFSTYETGAIQRSVTENISRFNGLSFGFQHGLILSNHYDYYHQNVVEGAAEDSNDFSVPNLTFVYGKYWRDILVNTFSYSKTSVAVSGDFVIPKAKSLLGSSVTKNNICICTNTDNTLDYLFRVIDAVVSSCFDPTSSIFIALHPSEKHKSLSLIKSIMLNFPSEAMSRISIVDSAEEGINKSFYVISQPSFVLVEAVRSSAIIILADFYDSSLCKYFSDIPHINAVRSEDELIELLDRPYDCVNVERDIDSLNLWAFPNNTVSENVKFISQTVLTELGDA
jgi:hypothetical protein